MKHAYFYSAISGIRTQIKSQTAWSLKLKSNTVLRQDIILEPAEKLFVCGNNANAEKLFELIISDTSNVFLWHLRCVAILSSAYQLASFVGIIKNF